MRLFLIKRHFHYLLQILHQILKSRWNSTTFDSTIRTVWFIINIKQYLIDKSLPFHHILALSLHKFKAFQWYEFSKCQIFLFITTHSKEPLSIIHFQYFSFVKWFLSFWAWCPLRFSLFWTWISKHYIFWVLSIGHWFMTRIIFAWVLNLRFSFLTLRLNLTTFDLRLTHFWFSFALRNYSLFLIGLPGLVCFDFDL